MGNVNDELEAMAAKLRKIKAPKGQGNGYNMPGGKKKLAARIKDAALARQKEAK